MEVSRTDEIVILSEVSENLDKPSIVRRSVQV